MEILRHLRREAHQVSSLGKPVSEGRLLSKLLGTGDPRELAAPLDFNRLAQDGFRVNPIIYGCIRVISTSVAEPTLKALTVDEDEKVKTDTVVAGDRLAKLLIRPNDSQDQFEFYEQLLIHLMFAGNAFIHKVRAATGEVVQMELIRPDIMGLIPGTTREEGKVKAYTVKVGESLREIPKDDIIHFRLPDALDEFWGLSPVFVLARYGDVDLQSADFLRAYFLNKGIPAGILTFEHQVQKPERERVRDMWKEQFNSVEGWHNLAVLDAKVQYQNIQTGIKDVDMDGITNQTETRICAVYGVPPILISALSGISHATFANAEESRRLFWMDTATPLFTRLSKKLTIELAMKEFGDTRRIVFDLTSVPALQENKSEVRKIAMQGWNSGLFTRAQAFTLLGHQQESQQGDIIKVLPGTEFRPIESVTDANQTDNITPQAGGATANNQQGTEPTETHLIDEIDGTLVEGLEVTMANAFDRALVKFGGHCPFPPDDPRCAAFDVAFEDDDDETMIRMLSLDMRDFSSGLEEELRSYGMRLCAGRGDAFVPNVTPSVDRAFTRLTVPSRASQELLLSTDQVVNKKGLLFRSVGLLPNQTMTLIRAEAQFVAQRRTEDETNTALDRLRQALLLRHRDAFAKEAAALVEREIKEQIELRDLMGEEKDGS